MIPKNETELRSMPIRERNAFLCKIRRDADKKRLAARQAKEECDPQPSPTFRKNWVRAERNLPVEKFQKSVDNNLRLGQMRNSVR